MVHGNILINGKKMKYRLILMLFCLTNSIVIFSQYELRDFEIPELKMNAKFFSNASKVSRSNGYSFVSNYFQGTKHIMRAGLFIDTLTKCADLRYFYKIIEEKKSNLNRYEVESYYDIGKGILKISIYGSLKTGDDYHYYTIINNGFGTVVSDISILYSDREKARHKLIEESIVNIPYQMTFPAVGVELPLYGRIFAAPAKEDPRVLLLSDCKHNGLNDLRAVIRVYRKDEISFNELIESNLSSIQNQTGVTYHDKKVFQDQNPADSVFRFFDRKSVLYQYLYKRNQDEQTEFWVKDYLLISDEAHIVHCRIFFPFAKGQRFSIEAETKPIETFDKHLFVNILSKIRVP